MRTGASKSRSAGKVLAIDMIMHGNNVLNHAYKLTMSVICW